MNELFGINPDFPIWNAGGRCKTLKDVQDLAASAAGAIEVGSFTVLEREGNPGAPFYYGDVASLNALNLPNGGIPYLRQYGRQMVEAAHAAGKAIFLNVAGFSPEDFAVLVALAFELGFDGVIVNASCPNVLKGGKRSPIFSYYPHLMRHVFQAIFSVPGLPEGFVRVKFSWLEPYLLARMAKLVMKYPIAGVVVINAMANGRLSDESGNPILQTPDGSGLAGVSGPALIPLVEGQVFQWRKEVPGHIRITAVGGVRFAETAKRYLQLGADDVQVGTEYYNGNVNSVFGDLAVQF